MAIKEALEGVRKNHGGPFGAVIVKNGIMVSKAHNEVIVKNDPTAHAEVSAIRKAGKKLGTFNLSGCEIYSLCEPCPMCHAAILWARIKKIYYGCTKEDAENIGFDDSRFYQIINIGKDNRLLKKIQINRDEALKVFSEWASKPDKQVY